MASAFLRDEASGLGASVVHTNPSTDSIVVPDAHLLFSAHFSRSGPDLVLTGTDGRHYIVPDYFSSEHPPALAAPNGATLSGDVVGLMAGSPAPGEYAQTQPTAPPDLIGKVEKLVGSATAVRNGVSVTLNIGDAVYKSDVIETGPDSKVGIGFPDGTALELLANTRMALNEYSYDPNGHTNSALFTYVEGTFGFFAGKVAHTGDMKIATPVATMGIRGTTGVMGQGTDQNGHDFYWQAIYDDPGTNISGSWDDFGQNPDGTFFVESTVSQPGEMTVFTLQGPGLPPLITVIPIPESYNLIALAIIDDLADIIRLLNVAPHSLGAPGSPENPLEVLPPENLPGIPGNGPQLIFYVPIAPPGGPPVIVPIVLPPSPGTQTGFIWPSGTGTWDTAFGWIGDQVPISSIDTVTIESGDVQYGNNGNDNYAIATLLVDQPAELDIVSGSLNVQNGLDDGGVIVVGGDPPSFTVSGPVTIEAGGQLIARGSGALIDLTVATVNNSGTIAARHGGDVEFIDDSVTNAAAGADSAPGKIKSIGFGSVVDFTGVDFDNGGVVLAKDCGGIFFVDSAVTNDAGARFTAKDGGSITFSASPVDNSGVIRALFGGFIKFEDLVTNETGGDIRSAGCESCVVFTGNELDNFGTVAAAWGGQIKLFGETIVNEAPSTSGPTPIPGGSIVAKDWGVIKVEGGSVENQDGAVFEATHHGAIDFKGSSANSLDVTNDASGKFEAADCGVIRFDGRDVTVTNDGGTFVAKNFGAIFFDRVAGLTNEDGGKIEAKDGGLVGFRDVQVANAGGLIEAIGCGAAVELAHATVMDGTLQTRDGGVIETVFGHNTFSNVTLNGALVRVDCGTTLALVDGAGLGSAAVIDKTVTFEGGGTVVMAYQSYVLVAGADGGTLINDSTIAGLGQIGVGDGALTFINHGVVTAHAIGPLHGDEFIIDTGIGFCGAPTTINTGLLEACGPCVSLLIEDTTLDNTCGTIAAYGPGAAVDLVNSFISGGTLATGDACDPCFGIIEILSPVSDGTNMVVFDGTGQKVTVDGFVQVEEGATLELKGTIDNNGTIDVDASEGSGADLAIDGTVKLHGHGVVTLDGSGDEITGVRGTGATLDNFSTIRGDGSIGTGDNALTLVNEKWGTIEAVGGFCDPLVIDTGNKTIVNDGLMQAAWFSVLDIESKLDNSGSVIASHRGNVDIGANVDNEDGGKIEATHAGSVTLDDIKITNDEGAIIKATGDCSIVCIDCSTVDNDGAVEAKHGGSVFITDTTVRNAGGVIEAAGSDSTVDLAGATIEHGTLETLHDGLIQTVSGNSTFDGVTIADDSEVLVNDGTTLTLESTIHNHGTIDVDEAQSGASLIIDGAVTLDGDGTVTLDGHDDAIVAGSCDATLDNVNNTIAGYGQIGDGGDQLTFDNGQNGTVDADVAGKTLVIDTGCNTVGNTGDLESTNGGILKIKSNVDNTGGTIGAFGLGSLTKLIGVTVTGGTLATGDPYWLDDGVIAIAAAGGAMSVFDGISHAVKIEGFVQVDPGAQLELQGKIDNEGGTIYLEQTYVRGSDLVVDGDVTLNGSGAVALTGPDTGIVGSCCGGTLDNYNGISGAGFIGQGDSLTFINEVGGWVNADGAAVGPIVIDTGCNVVTNAGLLEATYGSELDLYGTIDNAGGAISALAEGGPFTEVKLFGATIEGGTLTTDSLTSGTDSMIEVTAGAMSEFDGSVQKVTVDGYVQVDDGASLALTGTIDNLGTINVDGTLGADLVIEDTVKLKGGGDVILAGAADSITGGSGAVLDNVDNTISGSGTISVPTVDNNGTIKVDANGLLTISGNVTGNGSLDIGAKATLELAGSATNVVTFLDPHGTLQIDSTGISSPSFSIEGGGAMLPKGDVIYLPNISYVAADDSYNAMTHTITVGDGSGTVSIDVLGGIGAGNTFVFNSLDGGTEIFDPPATAISNSSVAIGGSGNDQFIFHSGVGAETIANFNPQHETIDLDHFAHVQSMQELGGLITGDPHGNAVIDLGHHDSITLPGMTAAELHAVLRNSVHLH